MVPPLILIKLCSGQFKMFHILWPMYYKKAVTFVNQVADCADFKRGRITDEPWSYKYQMHDSDNKMLIEGVQSSNIQCRVQQVTHEANKP